MDRKINNKSYNLKHNVISAIQHIQDAAMKRALRIRVVRTLIPIFKGFDADHYLHKYPDVVKARTDPYVHFFRYGFREGRSGQRKALKTYGEGKVFRAGLETVLVVSHDATRTGAPILAWNICKQLRGQYNVVTLLLGGGDITSFFEEVSDIIVGPYEAASRHSPFDEVLEQVIALYNVKFAIVNSIESRTVLKTLAYRLIPSVLLVHEFFAYTYPQDQFISALKWASTVVFPATIVQQNVRMGRAQQRIAASYVIPQGKSEIPTHRNQSSSSDAQLEKLRAFIESDVESGRPFVVLGAGTVQYRKGVDLFIAAAAELKKACPSTNIKMVWVGHGYDPDHDFYFSSYLKEQIIQSGLNTRFHFFSEICDFEKVYALCDLLFLSSRLDPLPNVTIDAMVHGKPVICFDGTTGISDILVQDPLTASCIIGHSNISAATQLISELQSSRERYNAVSARVKALAETNFNMASYVSRLVELAKRSIEIVRQERADFDTLMSATDFDVDFCLSPFVPDQSREAAILGFIRSWCAQIDIRNPRPGFDLYRYAEVNGLIGTNINPFAHYIRSGRPAGSWEGVVFDPSEKVDAPSTLRCAVHIHAFYPDLLMEIIDRLRSNTQTFDIFISVPSKKVLDGVEMTLQEAAIKGYHIKVVPNRGRDIGPFLTAFANELQGYDLVGHFHTKKSMALNNAGFVRKWVDYLLGNLLGDGFCAADGIASQFAQNPGLGLVYADDPHVVGWTENRLAATQIAKRIELTDLPDHLGGFPVGTMFWARPDALAPLFTAKFDWSDYPDEPLPYDGTILHAIERLLPLVAQKQGYSSATVHYAQFRR